MGYELRALAKAKAAHILIIFFTLVNFNKQAVTLRVNNDINGTPKKNKKVLSSYYLL